MPNVLAHYLHTLTLDKIRDGVILYVVHREEPAMKKHLEARQEDPFDPPRGFVNGVLISIVLWSAALYVYFH